MFIFSQDYWEMHNTRSIKCERLLELSFFNSFPFVSFCFFPLFLGNIDHHVQIHISIIIVILRAYATAMDLQNWRKKGDILSGEKIWIFLFFQTSPLALQPLGGWVNNRNMFMINWNRGTWKMGHGGRQNRMPAFFDLGNSRVYAGV